MGGLLMRKRFLLTMVLLLIYSYTSINGYEYREETNTLEYLLNERIKIMNEFLYGYKDMNDLEKKLKIIERDNLLENDLSILCKVMDCPTDYELAMSVKVHKINDLEIVGDEIIINADLDWSMSGYDGEYNLIRNYEIKCVENNKQMYLSQLKIMND